MDDDRRLVSAGRVGRPHGLEGSFTLRDPRVALEEGMEVRVGESDRVIAALRGSADRLIVRLAGVEDRQAAGSLVGEDVWVEADLEEPGEMEWRVSDLVGCRIEGLGRVASVMAAPSCDVLEIEDGTLVPLVSDAVTEVDVEGRTIVVDRGFLGLD